MSSCQCVTKRICFCQWFLRYDLDHTLIILLLSFDCSLSHFYRKAPSWNPPSPDHFSSRLPHGIAPLQRRLNPVHSAPERCPFRCRSVFILANGLLSEGRAHLFHLPQHLPGPRQLWLRALLLQKVHRWALEQTGASRNAGLSRVPQNLHRSTRLSEPQVVQHRGALLGLPAGRHP